jgi:hypothetical protein
MNLLNLVWDLVLFWCNVYCRTKSELTWLETKLIGTEWKLNLSWFCFGLQVDILTSLLFLISCYFTFIHQAIVSISFLFRFFFAFRLSSQCHFLQSANKTTLIKKKSWPRTWLFTLVYLLYFDSITTSVSIRWSAEKRGSA